MALAVQALESTPIFSPSSARIRCIRTAGRCASSSARKPKRVTIAHFGRRRTSSRSEHPRTRLLSMIDLPPERHLELHFGDTTDPDARDAAPLQAIEATFAFIDSLPEDANLLIHCLRGIGRSTALSLGVLARYVAPEKAASSLHALRPEAKPNRHVLGLCDAALGLKGKLVKQALRFPAKVWKD